MDTFFKKEIKKVALVCRDLNIESSSQEVLNWFRQRNIHVQTFVQENIEGKVIKTPVDLILILGGDGTYLSAIRLFQNQSIPMLGINMGSLGFLTVHVKEKLLECLENTLNGEMIVEERSLIQVYEESNGLNCLALNDVVIERGENSQLIDLSVYLENRLIYSLKADGLIIASATGSTAYNLAAGGPVLHPRVEAFVVTPICPHSLTHRPVLFPDNQQLKINVKNSARLTVDGRKLKQLSPSSSVLVQKSDQIHQTLRNPKQCEFIYLKDKLKFFEQSV